MNPTNRLFRLLVLLVAVTLTASGCSVTTKDFDTLFPEFDPKEGLETAQSSLVYDRNGVLITRLRADQNRRDVIFDEIPEVLVNAVVAIEDERFWEHDGVDLKAILRAARSNVTGGGVSQGGSTITQQFVGNRFLDRTERTAGRKVEEIFMARRFEQRYAKEFILQHYLNWVNFGNGAYGVEAAAREYFGDPNCGTQLALGQVDDLDDCLKITELTLVEAATLAGLIQAPGRFDPYRHYDAARDRRNLVLSRMLVNGYITQDEYDTALTEPIDLIEHVPVFEERYPAAHFVEDVKQWFFDNPAFGDTRDERIRLLFEGGLKIHTTIDLGLQAQAEAAVERVLPQVAADGTMNPDSAAVIMGTSRSDDGHILAMVSGRDFFGGDEDAKFNLASGSGRQAGSAMKPIGLAAALQMGIPITRVYDATSPIEITEATCGPTWKVRGGKEGDSTLADALTWSRNTVFAQLVVDIGPQRFVQMAETLGIGKGRIQPVCAAILGSENVNMVEMATVYATLARNGVRVDPVMVTSITNPDGTQLYRSESQSVAVLNSTVASQMTWVLSTVIDRGTGTRARVGEWPVAGKTGTAQNNADAAFAGYTAQRSVAVWVGYPDKQEPMLTQFNGARVQGGTFPALIFSELMTVAMRGLTPESFPQPPPSSTTTTLPEVPDSAIVPDLLNRTLDEELEFELLEEAWPPLSRIDIKRAGVEPGTIILQIPLSGTEVPGGSVITVHVAATPDPVPDVLGLTESEATQALSAAGYDVVIQRSADPEQAAGTNDGSVPPGSETIWMQDPVPGTEGALVVTITLNLAATTSPTSTAPADPTGGGDDEQDTEPSTPPLAPGTAGGGDEDRAT